LGGSNITPYAKTVLIYNAYAGQGGRIKRSLQGAAEVLREAGHNLTIVPTVGRGTATEIAREHIHLGFDLVLATGGDGTINEVAEGMVHSHVPLGILPGGTANVLATEMRLGSRMVRAAAHLVDCRPHRISVGHVTCGGGLISRHFLLMAGVGLDASIVYRVSGPLKARTGKFAYWVAGWGLLGRKLPEFHVEVAGEQHHCSFALVSKVKNYGGDLEIAREVSLFDDHFEVVLFEGSSTLPYVKYLWGVITNRLRAMRGVTTFQAETVDFFAPEDSRIHVQIDGEFAGPIPGRVRIVRDALTVLVPPEYERLCAAAAVDSSVERNS
jgi:YegS/Rv2252/BmrU family lipid kinase